MDTKQIEALEARVKKAEEAQAGWNESKKTMDKAAEDLNAAKKSMLAQGSTRTAGTSINSDEQQAMRAFRVPHFSNLLSVNTCDPQFMHVKPELKSLVNQVKAEWDIARWTQQLVHGEPLDRVSKDGEKVFTNVKGVLDGNYFAKNVMAPRLKAFATDTSPAQEWVHTATSAQYIEEYELNREVMQLFKSVSMPSKSYEMPKQNGVTKARRQAENATIPGSTFGTDKIILESGKLTEFHELSEEINEDSAPNILAAARFNVTEAILRAIEDTIMNGDNTTPIPGNHMDSDIVDALDAQHEWKGLRKLALDNSATIDFLNGAVDITKLRAMVTLMSKFGIRVRELAWIATPKVYNQMRAIAEVTTVEKFGPQATILQGALAALDGIPIHVSEFGRDDLNATAVHDGITTDRSVLQLVNHTRFFIGQRRPIRIRVSQHPVQPNDQWLLAAWWRGDFRGHSQSAQNINTVTGLNIA